MRRPRLARSTCIRTTKNARFRLGISLQSEPNSHAHTIIYLLVICLQTLVEVVARRYPGYHAKSRNELRESHFMSVSDCILQDLHMASIGRAYRFQGKPSVNFQRGGSSAWSLLIASLMLSVSSAAVLAGDDTSSNSKAEQATKKSASEEAANKASTNKSASEEAANKAAPRKSASDEAANKALTKKLAAMERRMESLEVELKLKEAQAARAGRGIDGRLLGAQASDMPSKNNDLFGVAPSPAPGLKIGMYGEIKFGSQQNPAANGQWQNGFDMGRLVFFNNSPTT